MIAFNTYIIIVTYNGMKWISKCLASIPTEFSVIIVDNNSSDGTLQFIHQNYPHLILFKEKENLGFGQANNKGIAYALQQNADYVYLLNQDAYLEKDTIEKLINKHQQYPEYGILSPIHTNAHKNRLDKNFSSYINYQANMHFYSDFVLQQEKQAVYEVPFVNAAGWLLPKNTLLNVGGFDPIFFHYGEDDNYCQRLHYHGLKIGIVPNAYMVHDREDRAENKVIFGSEAYFKSIEKKFKVKHAHIQNFNENEILKERQRLKKDFLKALFCLKFKRAKIIKNKIYIYKQVIPKIKNSVNTNKKGGLNYL